MLNFCIFVFIAYFFKSVFRMVFPKKTIIHKGVLIAQYAGERQGKTRNNVRKTSENNEYNKPNKYNNKSRNLRISA